MIFRTAVDSCVSLDPSKFITVVKLSIVVSEKFYKTISSTINMQQRHFRIVPQRPGLNTSFSNHLGYDRA
jgi:hypothetical protein